MKRQFEISLLPAIDQINAKAYYTGKTKSAEEDPAIIIADIAEDDNADIVEASVQKAMGKLQGIIGIYMSNSIVRQDTTLLVTIAFPANYDMSAEQSLHEGMKQYCENMVLYDWFAVTSPQNTEYYAQQMVLAISDIRRALMQRTRPVYEDDTPRVVDTVEIIYQEEEQG